MQDDVKITLAAARVNAGMTQEKAAQALGISKQTLVNWENNKVIPGTVQLLALSSLYKLPIDLLFVPIKTT